MFQKAERKGLAEINIRAALLSGLDILDKSILNTYF